MTTTPPTTRAQQPSIRPIVASGLVALAVAMGIGRFAFTPLMPLMIRDGTLSPAAGAEWAAANYVGYLLGALTASWFARDPRRGLLLSLLGVALTTLAMAAIETGTVPLLGLSLRASAGVFSAWALVCASGWCLAELARRQSGQAGAWIYTGVGLGIALAGLLTWLGGRQPAHGLWLELGALAGLGALFVRAQSATRSAGADTETARISEREAAARAPLSRGRQVSLVVCYGTFGFGYIVPATFLPSMARALAPDPLVFGLTWPLFGFAAALSVAAVARFLAYGSRLRIWALAQAIMALGTALPLFVRTLPAIALAAILVGGTFMVATMAGLQLAREARPDNPTPLLARMTAAFAAGQIAGPMLVRALGSGRWGGWDALGWTGAVATLLLILTALWLWHSDRAGPEPRHAA
ncbi:MULTISPECIES: YbfB/YjiJ family MFS transporter [unclassified Methylobacterium]|jgi:predicted MFS family arabinose efflux permease|uniref:YbfB/YjiJ family MFS transporter n=1 Tax=unclassified Methylobacterium TaxID=2615210 RepID=UPI0013554F79|nr:YbfB/YjiJ family MFS transporter [Methylobacterium sp. 2A]MWV22066.1 YbfB/YjiJ family MFS transporter [Methylobacterium sp. 2A]